MIMRGIEWLKSQCNRYKNGQCTTLKCLQDGGYIRGDNLANHDIATCEPHEILIELEELKDEIKSLERDIYNLDDSN